MHLSRKYHGQKSENAWHGATAAAGGVADKSETQRLLKYAEKARLGRLGGLRPPRSLSAFLRIMERSVVIIIELVL